MISAFRNTPAVLLALLVLLCLLAPVLPLHDPVAVSVAERFAGPSFAHPLGRDEYGRDLMSRLVWALRSAVFIAASSAFLASVVGTALGVIGGYVRGLTEIFTMRGMDVILCFPPLLLAMLAVTLYGPGPVTLIPVLGLVFVPSFTRVAHASVLTVRSHEYVEAARGMGMGAGRIMLHTILPNIVGPLIVQFSFVMAMTVVLESGLSFLGLGVLPPAPSLGLMIGAGRATLAQAPMLLVWPCLLLTLLILVLNAFCDRLRDHFDPRSASGSN
ncbi:peptide/nickel transport system permease protein [Pseudochelatococcus lubricantis]|uniref:Peptide/nickel transport system permease protein n=1 Tax=Pseudochelatococcus lubricantis TaxID=1538102 RepID=A0ABX0V3R9_9HYPH|nr:ABC transporter permease [Pseudochelatococcus lubricantis]NIJ59868.1 peptide/nickel transport system permease protein [Pseudochelatococcus lubricantis]